jgi:hypothetical protein
MNVPFVQVLPGMEFSQVQGIMTYSFSNMKLLPRNNNDMTLVTSVNNQLHSSGFMLYPNPAKEILHIRFGEEGSRNLSILNALGQEIRSGKMTGSEFTFPLSGFSAGLYRIRVADANGNLISSRLFSIEP